MPNSLFLETLPISLFAHALFLMENLGLFGPVRNQKTLDLPSAMTMATLSRRIARHSSFDIVVKILRIE